MTGDHLKQAIEEAERFLKRARELEAAIAAAPKHCWPGVEAGATRRASMDLTRSLARLRAYR